MCPVPIEQLSIERARYIVAHAADFYDRRHTLFPECWRVLRAHRPAPQAHLPGDAA